MLINSDLFTETASTADDFAEKLKSTVTLKLDKVARFTSVFGDVLNRSQGGSVLRQENVVV